MAAHQPSSVNVSVHKKKKRQIQVTTGSAAHSLAQIDRQKGRVTLLVIKLTELYIDLVSEGYYFSVGM